MHVKKYEAKTMKEALDLIKADLGPDAIILSAKDNSKKYGLVGEGSVEVTAAISELNLKKKQIVENRLSEEKKDILRKSSAKTQKSIINKSINSKLQTTSSYQTNSKENTESKIAPKISPQQRPRYADIHDYDDENYSSQNGFEKDDFDNFKLSNLNFATERIKSAAQRAIDAVQVDNFSLFTSSNSRTQSALKNSALKKFENNKSLNLSSDDILNYKSDKADFSNSDDGIIPLNRNDIHSKSHFQSREISNLGNQNDHEFESKIIADNKSNLALTSNSNLDQLNNKEQNQIAVNSLQKEVEELRKVIENLKTNSTSLNQSFYPGFDFGIQYELSFIFEKMINSGIHDEYASQIILQIQDSLLPHQRKNKSLIEGCVVKKFLDEIQVSQFVSESKIHIFIGASGHGKTSSLVKFASHLAIREKKKIGIATIDTYKVGAVEQLKIYAQILNVPFVVIRSPEDWLNLKNEIEGLDKVLLDTPGFGLRNTSELVLIHRLLPPEMYSSAHHLVLSATAKDEDAMEIGKRFVNIKFDDVIFTALDQSSKHGVIYNFHKYYNIPLHSFGTGSNIPEDFEIATSERLVDLIFKISNIGFGSNTISA